MSKVDDPNALNDRQKAKDAYNIHQDNLFWSRGQTLMTLQAAVLAGIYSLNKDDPPTSVLLTLVGLGLTLALWQIAERDQLQRDDAFAESGVKQSVSRPPWYLAIEARYTVRLIFMSLMVADVAVLFARLCGPCSYFLTCPWFLVFGGIWYFRTQKARAK